MQDHAADQLVRGGLGVEHAADVEHVADVRVVERDDDAGFVDEAGDVLAIAGELGGIISAVDSASVGFSEVRAGMTSQAQGVEQIEEAVVQVAAGALLGCGVGYVVGSCFR